MPYYSDDLIDEVIVQNDIIDVISEYIALKKRGRNFIGLCPFHREKTPSFCASMDKQIFKCFGCSEGGNVISFIMKIENLDFWDSVEFLANRANIDMSNYITKSSNHIIQETNFKDVLFNINKDVGIFYNNNLIKKLNEKSNIVKEYVKKRKFDISTIKKFGIGFADGDKPLYDHLLSLGYKKEDIMRTGIICISKNGKPYDRFFSRLMFPIFDIKNRTIAFGGRVLDNSLPKYVNSPENEIYHKGKTLYLMNYAKKEDHDNIIIVEGYMDAIALQKSGFHNVIASLGTALTTDQAKLLKKYTDNVIICYDQDTAGKEATMRGLDILSSKDLNVKVLKLDKSDVKDPDEYINKYGAQRFKKCIENSISLVEYKIERLEENLDINNVDSKINFLTQVANILTTINNEIEREIYIDKISKKYNIGPGPIYKEIEKKLNTQYNKDNDIVIDMQSLSKKMQMNTSLKKREEQYIILLILSKDKKIQEKIFHDIAPNDINNSNIKKIYEYIIELKKEYDINKIDILSKIKEDELVKEFTEILYINTQNLDYYKLLNDVLRAKLKERLYNRRIEILKRIKISENKDELEILKIELNQIVIQLSKFKR